MPGVSTAQIRNVLFAGHTGVGKTALLDRLLQASGAHVHVEPDKDERDHGFSLYARLYHADHLGSRLNLFDTPGLPDLAGQGLACLSAVETVVLVVSATAGIETNTRRMWDAAVARNLPRAIVINKTAADGATPETVLAALQEAFGPECLPITLPQRGGGVVECLTNRNGESAFSDVPAAHTALLDHIVEMDDSLMERYLGGDEPNFPALHDAFEKAIDAAHLVPVLFTDARTGLGVPELLDAIAKWFPSPLEGNPRPIVIGDDAATARPHQYRADPAAPLLAHVFKVVSDPYAGKLAYFRVHQGRCTGQSQVLIGHSKKPLKLAHIFHIQGKTHIETPELVAGDIGGVSKLEDLRPGDILHDDHALDAVHLAPEPMPTPMYGLAVVPKARSDEQKLTVLLAKIAEEDLTFSWRVDRQTHELVIEGVGEVHLRIVLERLAARGLHVDTHPPRIAYRETITAPAEGHHRHRKQTGGAGQFGEVYLRVEPLERGQGFQFSDEIFGGTIPGQYVPAVEKGVRDALDAGAISGHPIVDVKVTVYDGKHHPVDSKEIAFRTAGRHAFLDAITKARPVLLEPIVKLDITAPQPHIGAVTADLAGRRARILDTEILPGNLVRVTATAPLSEVQTYHGSLKSLTAGQGAFSMQLSHHDPAPPMVQKEITANWKPHVEEE